MDCSKATSESPGLMKDSQAVLDQRLMARAVELALLGRGYTAPNPCVGAVLAKGEDILSEGHHQRFGGPHAEVECLNRALDAGVDPAGCTMYVTLEPCNHHGKTPPCTEAILRAGISRVVVGAADPNPEVAGGGMERLRDGGICVDHPVLKAQCHELIDDFIIWKSTALPFTTLKLAATLDGRIAPAGGRREAVSSPQSFADVQQYRAWTDAIIVGGNTLSLDDPSLTRREEDGMESLEQPYAVAVTSRLPEPDCRLVRERPGQTVILTSELLALSNPAARLMDLGVRVWGLPPGPDGLFLTPGLARLRSELGVHRLLCEGGGVLATSLLEQELVHEFVLYLAPKALGDVRATPLLSGRSVVSMAQALQFEITRSEPSGPDLKIVLKPR